MQPEPVVESHTHETRVVAAVGFLSAASFVLMWVGLPMPGAPYLVYEPSDVPALVATFTMGPTAGLTVVALRNLLRLLIHPHLFGLIMNMIASGLFVGVAGVGYRQIKSRYGAVAALALATLAQTGALVLLNLAILPWYLGISGPKLTNMLLAGVLPFNLLKGLANSILVYLLYKRVSGFFPRV